MVPALSVMAKTIDQWLIAYGESHQNRVNKAVHWLCVPVITWTVVALLWQVAIPALPIINLGLVFIAAALVFYASLSWVITLGMAAFSVVIIALIQLHQAWLAIPLWQTALALFVVAWIGQFIGHKIEGKKPSFFKDLQFLFIGPAWLMCFIFRRFDIRY